MTKHFEQLWEESEALSNVDGESTAILLEDLIKGCKQLQSSPEEFIKSSFGHMLFIMTSLSKKLNINAYEALQNSMNDIRQEILDPE